MKNPIFVALDVNTDKEALKLARNVAPYVGGYKVGPRLMVKYGEKIVQSLAELGEVFVDNKYYDIPSTVVAAVRATFAAGASYTTVHASNGKECLEELAELEIELNQQRAFTILAVTVLTSFDNDKKPVNWCDKDLSEQVKMLAAEVFQAGLHGVVCSPLEVKELKSHYPQGFFVTPGIRLLDNSRDDQKRILTPQQAIELGASALVVGRPIVSAADPEVAASHFAQAVALATR
ncbi:MAG: orotidine-5'-phosphate decarboxylase [Bdellovibrionales bacterium]|nr:orotidine-5'-phosphate decarboxylase [Bdellovibrionales bacterium]